jgi:hypothetical protein
MGPDCPKPWLGVRNTSPALAAFDGTAIATFGGWSAGSETKL